MNVELVLSLYVRYLRYKWLFHVERVKWMETLIPYGKGKQLCLLLLPGDLGLNT